MENAQPSGKGARDWRQTPKEPIIMSTVENLRVLYEDNHLVVVNKRNSDIIQSDISGDRTLCETVKEYVRQKYNKPGLAFIGTVHRLDRPVSGIVIYARTTKALNRLSNMFKYREVQKTYWAVVKGTPEESEAKIINYLWKDQKLNKTFAFKEPGPDRKESELSYKVVGVGDNYTFVEVYPKTGRHHQIRATLDAPSKGTSSMARSAPTTMHPFTCMRARLSSCIPSKKLRLPWWHHHRMMPYGMSFCVSRLRSERKDPMLDE
jgi:23S rRNA pseudouridine1911/1915/1917 synthase